MKWKTRQKKISDLLDQVVLMVGVTTTIFFSFSIWTHVQFLPLGVCGGLQSVVAWPKWHQVPHSHMKWKTKWKINLIYWTRWC